MIEVRKKEGESSESLLRRFTKQVQQSRILIRVKKGRFFEPPKNKRAIRENAKRRQQIKDHKEHLRKIGKLDDIYDTKRKSYRR